MKGITYQPFIPYSLRIKGWPLTPQHKWVYSPYCSLQILYGGDMENLFNNQVLLELKTIAFIFDSGVIL